MRSGQTSGLQHGHRAGDHADNRRNHQAECQVAGPEFQRAHAFTKTHAGQLLQRTAVVTVTHRSGQLEPQQNQRQQHQQVEQRENHEGRAPVPLLNAPCHQAGNGGGGDAGTGQTNGQRQAAIAVEPEAQQLCPSDGQCTHADDGQQGKGDVHRPDRLGQLGGRQVAEGQQQQGYDRHAFDAVAQVEPPHELQ
ncbi:hypothetical protein D3C84_861800 [compost metagenome]